MKAQAQMSVSELATVVSQSTIPAIVAARFSLIVSLLAVLLSALALAVALRR